MNQMQLFENEQKLPERFAAFIEFHNENPGVFMLFCEYTKAAKRSGRDRISARMIGERIRWYTQIETTGDEYKVNDHHWPYYSRLCMVRIPELDGMFEVRDTNFDTDVEALDRLAW